METQQKQYWAPYVSHQTVETYGKRTFIASYGSGSGDNWRSTQCVNYTNGPRENSLEDLIEAIENAFPKKKVLVFNSQREAEDAQDQLPYGYIILYPYGVYEV